jgi:hypothetical protein
LVLQPFFYRNTLPTTSHSLPAHATLILLDIPAIII